MRANEAIINKILASGDFNQERKEERMYYGSSTQLRTHL